MNLSEATNQSRSLWRLLAVILIVAVLINYVWELAQAPLYKGMDSFTVVWWHCGLASLGDGLLVLVIYVIGWAALRRRNWFANPGVVGYCLTLTIGLAIAVSIELIAVFITKRWAYTEKMPLVPGLGVGLVPIAQMVVLPPLSFLLVTQWFYHSSARGEEECPASIQSLRNNRQSDRSK